MCVFENEGLIEGESDVNDRRMNNSCEECVRACLIYVFVPVCVAGGSVF